MIAGSYEDKYNSVGSIMYTSSKHGSVAPIQLGKDGMAIVLSNTTGSSPSGDIPYVDILHLRGYTEYDNAVKALHKPDTFQKRLFSRLSLQGGSGCPTIREKSFNAY